MRLEVEDVSVGYGQRTVISGITFTIDRPGLYCIIGPNGVGKSTLIKAIDKLLPVSEGRITVNGRDLADIDNKENARNMAYVPVAGYDLFSLPVVEAVLIGRFSQQGWKTRDKDLHMVYRTLKMMGLGSLSMRGSNELSAGQHQKVAIARGLVQESQLLLLDEPTANLDVRYQVYVAELLREMVEQTGITVIMISHDLNIAAKYADKLIVLGPPGRLWAWGTPEEVLTEDLIRDVYGVDCELIQDRCGRPHIILGSALRIDG